MADKTATPNVDRVGTTDQNQKYFILSMSTLIPGINKELVVPCEQATIDLLKIEEGKPLPQSKESDLLLGMFPSKAWTTKKWNK
jgi:hypothetical protein